ncbi:MAG: FadR/GntR family transcriptional regulator [Ardenticatenaceae bacterium]|nr:FadR/GntR family transcriptional regulator [Ardenticatenaceae bacterium]
MLNLRGPALSRSIRDYIKDYIVSHNLKAGDPLPSEGQLAEALGVSRSPVREAVKALQSLGIIEARRGEGLFVREWNFDPVLETLHYGMRISPKTLGELYQIRVWLEVSVIVEAVRRITDDQITDLEIVMLKWERAVRAGESYVQFDQAFHEHIFAVLGNETLVRFFKVFWAAFDNFGDNAILSSDPERTLKQHQEIMAAIKSKEPQLAQQKLQTSFIDFQKRIAGIEAKSQRENEATTART